MISLIKDILKKSRKNRNVFALVFAFCGAFCGWVYLGAMDWPSSNGRLAANFGTGDGGLPIYGNIFNAEGDVYTADPGDLLFYSSEETSSENTAQTFVAPLGNWAAVDHGDGVISVYARLGDLLASGHLASGQDAALKEAALKKAESENTADKDIAHKNTGGKLEKGENLAHAGKSGWSERNGFLFAFYDRYERQWINPVRILSSMADTIPPSLQSVKLKNSSGQIFDLAQTRTLRQGSYTVMVSAVDRAETADGNLTPFRIVCTLNGTETGRLEMEAIIARDGEFLIYRNGLISLRQVYSGYPSLEAAGGVSFTRGQVTLDVSVQDFAGNARNSSYRIYIE